MDGTSVNIKVLVKSPNQSVKDFAVDSRSDWTIASLKQFLSTNYPSNPVCYAVIMMYCQGDVIKCWFMYQCLNFVTVVCFVGH